MQAPAAIRVKITILMTTFTFVAIASMLGVVYFLYYAALESEKAHLTKIVDRQVFIINNIGSSVDGHDAIASTLPPHDNIYGDGFFSETGEVVIGRRDGDNILYYLVNNRTDQDQIKTGTSRVIPWQSNFAEPLRRAISGNQGTMTGYDYMGRTVLAAYGVSADGLWGVVAKLNLAAFQKPFSSIVFWIAISIIVIIAIGYFLFRILSHPFIERTKVEEELLENRKQMSAIMDNTADGIISMAADGTILTFNRAAEKMFRYSSDEVVGKNVNILMTRFDSDRHDGYVHGYIESNSKTIIGVGPREINGVRKDGSIIPLDLAVNEIKGVENITFVGSMRDISERIIQRKRIQRSQSIEAMGQLTRGVATDFNNILINIQENLDLLEGKHGRDTQSYEYIQNAARASKHGVEMIQRLLAFSRRQQLSPESINIKEVITETVKLAEPSLGSEIEVSLDVSRDLWSIVADKGQLENALLSLCLNSRDAMPSGGRLNIKAENIVLSKDEEEKRGAVAGEYIRLVVQDDGVGMTAGVVEKVFQPFFTTKDFGKGSGLGLSIIHSFIQQTGGTIVLHSEVGKGTEVEILFPRHGQAFSS